MSSFYLLRNAQRYLLNVSDVITHRFWEKMASYVNDDSLKRILSCKRLKEAHTHEVLAKKLETVNWVFGIEIKVVNTITENGFNFA